MRPTESQAAALAIRLFAPDDASAVIELWQTCDLTRPWNDPQKDIARKLRVKDDLFLVAHLHDKLVGTVMGGYEGHRGWINYLAVHPSHRQLGLGRALMADIETRLLALGCPKINLQVRHANTDVVAFYEAIGFVDDQVRSYGKRLIKD